MSHQGSKNTRLQLWDSPDSFRELCGYQHCASFCVGKEILRGERHRPALSHITLPLLTPLIFSLMAVLGARSSTDATPGEGSLRHSPNSISTAVPPRSTGNRSSRSQLRNPPGFFLPPRRRVSLGNRQALLSKSGTHADTLRALRGSLISLIKYARTHFKNMNPHTDKRKIY